MAGVCRLYRTDLGDGWAGGGAAWAAPAAGKENRMSRFGEGLRIIPRTAWAIAVFFYLVMSNLAFFVLTASDKEMRQWPIYGRALFSYGIFLLVVVMILLVGYVYADSKR